MKYSTKLILSIILFSLVLFSGCIQKSKLKNYDEFKSSTMLNLTEHLEKYNDPSLWGENPCTAMVCLNESDSIFTEILTEIKGLFKSGLTETHLAGTQCRFLHCNATSFNKMLLSYDGTINWGECEFEGDEKKCTPRFFMLGQGSSNADYTIAQQYCQGRLNMPVLWVRQRDDKPPFPPQPTNLMCYLSKNQMPVVVWYTDGEYIDDESYKKMLKTYDIQTQQHHIEGPIIVTTEALIDPYIYTGSKKVLNITLLDKIKNQLEYIEDECPKCLSALSLKPTFNESGLPDLCPLTYFFNVTTMDPYKFYSEDPLQCNKSYPSMNAFLSRPANTIVNFSKKIDMVGVGFIANDATNMTTCTPADPLVRHLLFSKQTLKEFQKPSVWYAVGMSSGATKTPYCSFTEYDVAKTYASIQKDIPSYIAAGVIGIAPYKFLDSSNSPLPSRTTNQLFRTNSVNSISSIKVGTNLESDTDPNNYIVVKEVFKSNLTHSRFKATDSNYYIAVNNNGAITISATGYQYGFSDLKANQKILSTYSWFSNCQYYFTNKGPLFETPLPSAAVSINQIIRSNDGFYSLQVNVINKSTNDESIFYAQDTKRYMAKKDGNYVDIYDLPTPKHAFQQPLLFSRSGTGGVCTAAEAVKMSSRSPLSKDRNPNSDPLTPPDDKDLRKKISQMQCGACLATSPMPKAFCKLKSSYYSSDYSFPENACTDYPMIDIQFLQKSLDNIFMRAIAVQETGLGSTSSTKPPACKVSDYSSTSCLRNEERSIPYKSKAALNSVNSSVCTPDIVSNIVSNLKESNPAACGIGLMQCIDGVKENTAYTSDCGGDLYNPFEPKNSACCGANVFLSNYTAAQNYLFDYLDKTNNKAKVGPGELNWYAAWIAAYNYFGINIIPYIESYDGSDTLVSHVNTKLSESNYAVGPNADYKYGTKVILRYNEAIKTCNTGCLYQSCTTSSGSSSGSLDGDASDSDVVDDGYEDEFYLPVDEG